MAPKMLLPVLTIWVFAVFGRYWSSMGGIPTSIFQVETLPGRSYRSHGRCGARHSPPERPCRGARRACQRVSDWSVSLSLLLVQNLNLLLLYVCQVLGDLKPQ